MPNTNFIIRKHSINKSSSRQCEWCEGVGDLMKGCWGGLCDTRDEATTRPVNGRLWTVMFVGRVELGSAWQVDIRFKSSARSGGAYYALIDYMDCTEWTKKTIEGVDLSHMVDIWTSRSCRHIALNVARCKLSDVIKLIRQLLIWQVPIRLSHST